MIILVTIFVVSIVFYLYFKVRILNHKNPLYMHYTNGKARIALGVFIASFGINAYGFYQTQFALFVCILFLILGGAQIVHGYKVFKHYRGEIIRLQEAGDLD
ncbi:YtpI family protein [Alkalibacillus salilacus]|uniref:YtpI family protein n=1 Tax=Alkalibacillus salilacus TaxID=284582 RepID=UPI0027D8665D|nr:YtpI family protein [Alkalibacillus salilacus]